MLGIGRELNIQFALGYEPGRVRRRACTAIAEGKVDLAPWLTGTVGIDGVPQAFRDLGRPRSPRQDPRRHPDDIGLRRPQGTTTRFPRQYARTQRFTLGEPRNLVVSPDGQRSCSCAAAAGDDPVNCLWVLDLATGDERLVADPLALLEQRRSRRPAAGGAGPSRAHAREAPGVTAFATDRAVTVVAVRARRPTVRRRTGQRHGTRARRRGPVFDPRPDPAARRVAYVSGRALRIAELDGSSWELAGDEDPEVSWGSADFIAAEEMHRFRGYWWSPDGAAIAACRVERRAGSAVAHRRSGAARRATATRCAIRRPAPPTPTSSCTCSRSTAASVDVEWDRDRSRTSPPCKCVETSALLLTRPVPRSARPSGAGGEPDDGRHHAVFADHDDQWVELVPARPDELDDGRVGDGRRSRRCPPPARSTANRSLPTELQVRAVVGVRDDAVMFHANPLDDATVQHVWQWSDDGADSQSATASGMHTAVVGGWHDGSRAASTLDRCGSVTPSSAAPS